MAVEIPVVIDIEKAFDDAARRVDTAIRPLKQEVERSTSDLKLNVAFGSEESDYRTLDSILKNVKEEVGGVNFATQHLVGALADAKSRLDELYSSSTKGKTLSAEERLRVASLREAIVLIESELDLRKTASRAASEAAQRQIDVTHAINDGNVALQMEANTMAELSNKISALRGKLENINPLSNKKEWSETASEIRKATDELAKYRGLLKETTKPGSIDRLRAEMSKLESQWNSMSKRNKFDADGKLTASAQRLIDKYRELTKESERYGQSLADMAGKAKPSIDRTTRALSSQGVVLKNLTSIASTYVSVFGLLRLAKQIRDVTGELEYQRVALGHLLQDVDRGNALFERIKEAAIESPFRIKDLVTYTKQLAAYRIEQEELFDTTKRLADISAGLGVDMNRLILAYGQVRAASVLRGQELRQFTEAGIPLVELLAEKFTDLKGEMVSTADVFKLISERAVPFSMIADIFDDLTESGGMFYKMQEEQAKTLKGRWEKLKDSYDIALQSIGDTETFQRTNDIVINVLRFVADNLRVIIKLADSAVISWAAYNAVMLIAGKRTKLVATEEQAAAIATAMRSKNINGVIVKIMGQAAAEKALTAATTQATIGTNALSRALGRLKIVLLTNPWAAAATAILGLVLALSRYKKAADDSAEATNTLNRAVDDMHTENRRYDRVAEMIKQYEELSKISEKNAAQNETLSRTIKKLAAEFPEYSERIKNSNLSLEQRMQLVKDLNSEEEKRIKAVKDEKEATLKASETKLSYAESEADVKHQAKIDATNYYNAVQDQLEDLQNRGKKGRGWFGKFLFGGNEYDLVYSTLVGARQELDKSETEYNNAEAAVEGLKDGIKALRKELYGFEEETSQVSVGWKELLKEMQLSSTGAQLFSNEQFDGWNRLFDVSKDLEKEWKKLIIDIAALKSSMPSKDDPFFASWLDDLKTAQAAFDGLDAIRTKFHFDWKKDKPKGGYKQDPFIIQMQNRIKFMQDFKKGYDDLSKYMAKSGALEKESEIMLGRGTSLGLSAADQKRAAEDLSKWYDDMINEVSSRLRAKGVSGASVTDLLGIDTTKRSKAIQDLQKLLQQLWDAKTDFDTSNFKKSVEDELKRVSDEIKRSETARNFYQNILDLTGDEQLAATMGISVYGEIGSDFKDRMQKELNLALSKLDPGILTDELRKAVSGQDFDVILKYLDKFPPEWKERLKEMAADSQKFEADRIVGLFKALQSAKTYGEKRVELAKQTAKRTAEIEARNIPDAEKKTLLDRNARKEAEEAAKLQYEAFKDTPMYVELFADLDAASARMLRNMQTQLESMKANWKDLHPRELKELQSRLSEIDKQLALRNPFKVLIDSIKEYNSLRKTIGRRDAENRSIEADNTVKKEKDKLEVYTKEYEEASKLYKTDDERYKMAKSKMEAQQKAVDLAIKEAEEAQNTANRYREIRQHIMDAGEGLMKWKGYLDDSLSAVGDIVDTFGSADTSEIFNILSGGISKTMGGAASLAMGIGTGNPVQILQGISGIVTGIAKTVQDIKFKRIENDIKYQQELLDELEYSYGRLEKVMQKSFGSEYIYNYNQQLEALVAKQAAYEEQARLEREKGKKADKEKIRDYENAARDVADQIMDMRSQLSEFFTGTDLASAAQDFADAWIDAYKEFSSTTDAMSEKFNDMIESMISRSLAAKVMQEMLAPIFDQIDELAKDGLLSTEEIAAVAALAQERIPMINDAMTNLMTSLASAGQDVRTQTVGLKGISKGYATASEESILGLAAAVNTQNFYISYVPTISENVAQILAAMTGGVSTTAPALTNENGDIIPSVQQMVYDHLPSIDQNISEMLRLFRSVVTTKNASTNSAYVAVK